MTSSGSESLPAEPESNLGLTGGQEASGGGGGVGGGVTGARGLHAGAPSARQVALEFLAERQRLDGLAFQAAAGYWANTYVPGDPVMRRLAADLRSWDRSALQAAIGTARFEQAALPAITIIVVALIPVALLGRQLARGR